MKIAIAQIGSTVGAFDENTRRIEQAYARACRDGARVLITPELSTCGYVLQDLLERPELFEKTRQTLERLKALTRGQKTALVVGHVRKTPSAAAPLRDGRGSRLAQNAISVFDDGACVFERGKRLLPAFDVFDEHRQFEPDTQALTWKLDGLPIGIAICEDFWGTSEQVASLWGAEKPKLLISVSASPYAQRKLARRIERHARAAREFGAPLVYVNQVGATDEVIFDGASFVLDSKGECRVLLPSCEEAIESIDLQTLDAGGVDAKPVELPVSDAQETRVLLEALVLGLKSYVSRLGKGPVLVGLSGGIDSAVVAALAVRALGSERVIGVSMSGPYSSGHSLADAEALAKALKIDFEIRPIKFAYASLSRELTQGSARTAAGLSEVARENLQSRLRGLTLMTLSNHLGGVVLATGNKSEFAMGYCTLYGDLIGALAPLGDLTKRNVYRLGRELNAQLGNPIPERTFTKPPSAELKPDQKDEDTLPPYDVLDEFVEAVVERGASWNELKDLPRAAEMLERLWSMEYKRRQSPPVLRVTDRAFGIGRRIPLSKDWKL